MSSQKAACAMVFLASLGWAGPAQAAEQVEPCGGLMIDAIESCEVVDDRCWEWCTPQRSMLACVAEHAQTCARECEAEASPQCVASCQQSCELRCDDTIVPGDVGRSCEDGCRTDCSADCKANCADSEFPELCELACPYQCAGHCEDACDEDVGQAGCESSCESACVGSCTATASRSCELECQAEVELECTERAAEACHDRCLGGGALFCDTHYVEISDEAQVCVDALEVAGVELTGPVEKLDAHHVREAATASGCSVHERASLGLSMAVFALFGFGFGTSLLRVRRSE
jgi:hypothetical protein